jgi:hypothetical protein
MEKVAAFIAKHQLIPANQDDGQTERPTIPFQIVEALDAS